MRLWGESPERNAGKELTDLSLSQGAAMGPETGLRFHFGKDFFLSCSIVSSDPIATNEKWHGMEDMEFEMF